jgi:hypothetical protein
MTIHTRPVFSLRLQVPTITDLGVTPNGHRRIATVASGTFEGERLRGHVHAAPGGDWITVRTDGVVVLDVRLTLETDDKALIYMQYRGLRHGPADVIARLNKGEPVDPSTYYFRSVPVFETSSEKYAWLNQSVFVATGRREAAGPIYDVFEVL